MRHRLSYVALIATHLVESLVYVPIMVGILFFLFEFFSDQLLAFFVLSMIWICEVGVCSVADPSRELCRHRLLLLDLTGL